MTGRRLMAAACCGFLLMVLSHGGIADSGSAFGDETQRRGFRFPADQGGKLLAEMLAPPTVLPLSTRPSLKHPVPGVLETAGWPPLPPRTERARVVDPTAGWWPSPASADPIAITAAPLPYQKIAVPLLSGGAMSGHGDPFPPAAVPPERLPVLDAP